MAQDTSAERGFQSGVMARPAGSASQSTRATTKRRTKTSPFGLLMLAPSLLLLTLFFFAPVVLTAIFSFTNMSSSTGISGGAYVITPNLLKGLEETDIPKSILEQLSAQTIMVDEQSLQAAQDAGIDSKFLQDISDQFAGETFKSSREFQRALKKLPSRPRSIRELKLAMEPFERSILNTRFDSHDAAADAVRSLAPDITDAQLDTMLTKSYTGWTWSTDNYETLKNQPETLRILGNTVFYVAVTLALFNVGLGLFIAVTTFYLPKQAGTIFSVVWLMPRITPVVLYTVMWKWFTWNDGFLPVLAQHLGLPAFNYMKGSVPTAWATVISMNGFIGASFGMILFSGALRSIPVQQLWASEVDGASRWQQIRRIILPHLRWPILFVSCYQGLSLLSSYEQIWLTTNGGPGSTTMVWALEAFRVALSNYTGNLQYGYGAAMAMVLVVAGLILSITFLRMFRFNELVEKPKIDF